MDEVEHAVREVERLLNAGTRRQVVLNGAGHGASKQPERSQASIALWLCACYDDDAPPWLIFGDANDLKWCTVPDRMSTDEVVEAKHVAGSHTSVQEVLEWLRGETALPGDYTGEPRIAGQIARRLNERD